MGETEEVTEEVRYNNSKLIIHRRKPLTQSSTSVDENFSPNLDVKFFHNSDAAKDYWSNGSAVSDLSNREEESYKMPAELLPSYQCLDVKSHNKRSNFNAFSTGNSLENGITKDLYEENCLENFHRTENLHPYQYHENRFSLTPRYSNRSNDLGRNAQNRTSIYSVSANSSVSNLGKSFLPTRGSVYDNNFVRPSIAKSIVLENISEENELERDARIEASEKYINVAKLRVEKIKYFSAALVIVVAVFCVVGGFIHYYVGLYPQMVNLNQADVLLLDSLSDFCSGVTAKSKEHGIRIISFKLSTKRNTLKYSKREQITIFPSSTWSRQFRFLKGSYVKFKIATDKDVEMLTFISEQNYTIWSQRKESETYLKRNSCCSGSKDAVGELELVADRDDVYTLAVFNVVEVFPVNLFVELEFRRESYDFTQTTATCTSSSEQSCFLPFPFNTHDRIALEIPLNENGKITISNEVEWKCEARIWLYCLVFIGSFLGITLTIILLRYIFIKISLPNIFLKLDSNYLPSYTNYYDNFGRSSSTISYATKNTARISSRMSTRTPSRLTNNSRRTSGWNSDAATAYSAKNKTISVIYNDQTIEQADSGISDDPEYSPVGTQSSRPSTRQTVLNETINGSSANSTYNLMQLQDLRFDEIKGSKHQQKCQLVAGPRIENFILKKNPSLTVVNDTDPRNSQYLYPTDTNWQKNKYHQHPTKNGARFIEPSFGNNPKELFL